MLNFLTLQKTSSKGSGETVRMHIGGSRGGGGGQRVRTPLKNHKTIGFSSNTGTDPLKNHKVIKPALNVGHHWYDSETPFKWRFAGGSMLARLWWYLDRLSLHQLRKNEQKKGCQSRTPLAKLSGSAQKCTNSSEPSLRSDL